MLRLHPDRRAKASELAHHNWLDGIVVQGEIDVIQRAEMEERARREWARRHAVEDGAAGEGEDGKEEKRSRSKSTTRAAPTPTTADGFFDQDEVDALKPIDSGAFESADAEESRSQSQPRTQEQSVPVVGRPVPPPHVLGGGAPVLNAPPVPGMHHGGPGGLSRTAPGKAGSGGSKGRN